MHFHRVHSLPHLHVTLPEVSLATALLPALFLLVWGAARPSLAVMLAGVSLSVSALCWVAAQRASTEGRGAPMWLVFTLGSLAASLGLLWWDTR